jgi:hypothetical protein
VTELGIKTPGAWHAYELRTNIFLSSRERLRRAKRYKDGEEFNSNSNVAGVMAGYVGWDVG